MHHSEGFAAADASLLAMMAGDLPAASFEWDHDYRTRNLAQRVQEAAREQRESRRVQTGR